MTDASKGSSLSENLTRAEDLYQEYRHRVAQAQHVSINIGLDRLLEAARSGFLPPSVPPNQWDRLPRDNVERAFWQGKFTMRPVYGALNTTSTVGAAPKFNPRLWIKLTSGAIAGRTTFTSANTYNVLHPELGDFDVHKAFAVLQNEIFLWDDVPDCFLAKYQHPDLVRLDDYIEAQIWHPVSVDDIDQVFVRSGAGYDPREIMKGPEYVHGPAVTGKLQELP